jgi:hypothetical protein
MQYVIGWNVGGKELILQEAYSNAPRLFETEEDAQVVAKELSTDVGTCRVLKVVQEARDPAS